MMIEITFVELFQLLALCSMCFFAGASFDLTYRDRAIARKVAFTLSTIVFLLGVI